MLYPNNIKIKKQEKTKIIKEKLNSIKNKTKTNFKYLIFDRSNFFKRIKVKMHV